MNIKYNGSTRTVIVAYQDLPIIVSIDLDSDVKRTAGTSDDFSGEPLGYEVDTVCKLVYDIEVDGFHTFGSVSYVKSYPRAEYPEGQSEWDTPSIEMAALDAHKGTFGCMVQVKMLEAMLMLNEQIVEGILVDE